MPNFITLDPWEVTSSFWLLGDFYTIFKKQARYERLYFVCVKLDV